MIEKLTPRQLEVAQLVVMGYRNREIAARLCISVRTVESHRSEIMAKLGIKSVRELYQLMNPTPVVMILTANPKNTSIMVGSDVFNEIF